MRDRSARQARGKILAAVGVGIRPAADFDERIVAGLVVDGLVVVSDGTVGLPE